MKYNPATMKPGWETAVAVTVHAGDQIEAFGLTWEVCRVNRGTHQVTINCRTKVQDSPLSKGMHDASFETTLPSETTVTVRRAKDDPKTALARKLVSTTAAGNPSWDYATWDQRQVALNAASIALREVGQ